MAEILGIIFALAAAVSWGSSLVPLKLAGRVDDIQYASFVTLGIFLSTLLSLPLLNAKISIDAYGLIAGMMWAIANAISIISVRLIGLSRAVPIIAAEIILLSFLWGILFFGEQLQLPLIAVSGIFLLLVGIPFVTKNENNVKVSSKGIYYAAISGIIFGSYLTPLKLSALDISDYLFSMTFGIFITGMAIYLMYLYTRKLKIATGKIANSVSSGFMWTIGNISSLFAIDSLGLGIGFPLTQLQLLIAVSWGIFYFKEIRNKKVISRILVGSVVLLFGAALLAFSK